MKKNFLTHYFRNHLKNRKGVSIIIALFMVSAFMLQMAAMSQQMNTSLELHRNRERSMQSYWNARSALELAMYEQTHTSEEEKIRIQKVKDQEKIQENNNGTTNNALTASWTIANNFEEVENKFNFEGKTYSIFPLPGTGTVGGDYCDPKKMPKTGEFEKYAKDIYFFWNEKEAVESEIKTPANPNPNVNNKYNYASALALATSLNILDHPCFWNKLESGKPPVSIPLYIKNAACKGKDNGFIEDGICNPKDVKLTDLILRIRMPCKDGEEICEKDDRWQLGSNIGTKKIVLWDITGKCKNNDKNEFEFCYLTNAKLNDKNIINEQNATILTGNKINNATSTSTPLYKILDSYSLGHNLKNVLVEEYPTPDTETIINFVKKDSISKPTFNLSIATGLAAGPNNDTILNNLEYQILYIQKDEIKTPAANIPIKSFISDPYITAVGNYGGFQTNLETSMSRPSGSFGYAVVNN